MQKAGIIGMCAFLFISAANLAQEASTIGYANVIFSAALNDTSTADSCNLERIGMPITGMPPAHLATAQCQASCYPGGPIGPPVSCSGGTCSAVDRDCTMGERGHVTCDGTTYYCTNPCTLCQKCYDTGDCVACCWCAGGTLLGCSQECNGG
jgi:hypothetical protein